VEVEADISIPNRNFRVHNRLQAACIHFRVGPAITVASVGKYAQADFDAADGFQDTSQTVGIFAVIGDIVKVWTLP
jgi:hypothetical protein